MRVSGIFLLLFLLTGCNQTGLGVWHAMKNLVTSPIDGIKSLFTNSSFEKKRESTSKNQSTDEEIRYCTGSDGAPVSGEKLAQLEALSESIMAANCACKPWGDCPEGVCSCDRQCPDDFKIFKRPEFMPSIKMTSLHNGLAFRNSFIPSQHEQTNGYCWGHARVTSQFNRLAFFKPNSISEHQIDDPDPIKQQKAIDYYKGLIDKIVSNETAEIPGFKSLYELSSHPALQSYIADLVATTWASHAMTWQGLNVATSSKQKPQSYYQKVFSDIKSRLDMNMQPSVVFTRRQEAFSTHVCLVSHYITQPDGSLKLCIRDNNYSETSSARCEDSMSLDPVKGLIYDGREIGDLEIVHNENSDALAQAEALREKCRQDRNCQNN